MNLNSVLKRYRTAGFWCQTIHQKWLKNDDEKWSRNNYFEIPRAPSEIPANLPGQFGLSGQIVLHWAAATLKGSWNFKMCFF